MDREGPETLARQGADAEPIETSVTAGAAARVAVILQKAEARAAAIAEEAERYAEQVARGARGDAARLEDEARMAAEHAARRWPAAPPATQTPASRPC